MKIMIDKYKFKKNGWRNTNGVNFSICNETFHFSNQNEFEKIAETIENLDKLNIGVKLWIYCKNGHFASSELKSTVEKIYNDVERTTGHIDFEIIDKKIIEWIDNKQLPDYVKQWIIKYYEIYQIA